MKIFAKLLLSIALVIGIYVVTANTKVYGNLDGCSGNTCQRCQCQYNKCRNQVGNPQNCDDAFLYCVNGDYTCTH